MHGTYQKDINLQVFAHKYVFWWSDRWSISGVQISSWNGYY